jgi:SAM-dependent methyltransferase
VTSSRCNGCGGELSVRLPQVVDPQSSERFEIATCQACGLGHTLPRPDDLGRYYGERYHGGRHGATDAYCTWRRARLVKQVLGEGRGRALLDVGCGDGTFLLRARSQGWSVRGTELNADIARQAGLAVDERLEDACQAGPYACITLWHSLEHLPDPAGALRSICQALAPGGAVIVAVPDASSLQARVFGAGWFHLDVPRHLFHFAPGSLRRMLEETGFQVERAWHPEAEYDLLGWSQSALNRILPQPNLFFQQLTGRSSAAPASIAAASWLLGTVATAAAVPLLLASIATGSPGTLVMVARRRA